MIEFVLFSVIYRLNFKWGNSTPDSWILGLSEDRELLKAIFVIVSLARHDVALFFVLDLIWWSYPIVVALRDIILIELLRCAQQLGKVFARPIFVIARLSLIRHEAMKTLRASDMTHPAIVRFFPLVYKWWFLWAALLLWRCPRSTLLVILLDSLTLDNRCLVLLGCSWFRVFTMSCVVFQDRFERWP